jgi:menaquinone-dependent protoporphyrinogen IX oxidase
MAQNVIVIYQSKYGATKRYATWIAEELGTEAVEHRNANPTMLRQFDCVVYGGGLYASGTSGVELVAKNPCRNLVVFTVGLADPEITDYTAIINKNFPEGSNKPLKIFHLRGAIDYKKLNLVHRGMMAMLKKAIDRKDSEQRSAEDNEIVRTYGGEVDFTDRESIAPLVEFVRGIVK